MDTAPTSPAIPPDVAALLRTNGPGVIDAAAAAGISPPPGAGVIPRAPRAPIGDVGSTPAPVEAPAVHDPAAAFKAAVAAGLAANAPSAQPAVPPGPQAGAGPAVAPKPAPTAVQPIAPVFLGGRSRSRTIVLDWPMHFDGFDYTAIVVTRPTTRQVGDYFDHLLSSEGNNTLRFPLFMDTAGRPVPEAVLDALDDDDATTVFGAVADFLPGRLRRLQVQQPEPSPLPLGAPIEPTSST